MNNLEDAGLDWGVFYSDFPTAFFLRETRDRLDNFHFLTTFYEKAAEGSLPAFSWVEPRYFYLPDMPSSGPPPLSWRCCVVVLRCGAAVMWCREAVVLWVWRRRCGTTQEPFGMLFSPLRPIRYSACPTHPLPL